MGKTNAYITGNFFVLVIIIINSGHIFVGDKRNVIRNVRRSHK